MRATSRTARASRSPETTASAAARSARGRARWHGGGRRTTGTRCGSTSRPRRARGRAGTRPPPPGGRGRRSCAAPPRAAGRPCARSTRVHGPTIENSLATTVVTPSKWPGRLAPQRPRVSPSTCTVVCAPAGYISSTDGHEQHVDTLGGRDRRGRPRGRAGRRRDPRSARTGSGSRTGSRRRASCAARAARMSERCPSWK